MISQVTSTSNEVNQDESLIHIKVIDREGTVHELEGPTDMGLNVMELCKAYELPIQGTCGGMALCSSCHVYIKSEHSLPAPSENEEATLDNAFEVEASSRLCCQLPLTPELDGLVLELAPE